MTTTGNVTIVGGSAHRRDREGVRGFVGPARVVIHRRHSVVDGSAAGYGGSGAQVWEPATLVGVRRMEVSRSRRTWAAVVAATAMGRERWWHTRFTRWRYADKRWRNRGQRWDVGCCRGLGFGRECVDHCGGNLWCWRHAANAFNNACGSAGAAARIWCMVIKRDSRTSIEVRADSAGRDRCTSMACSTRGHN